MNTSTTEIIFLSISALSLILVIVIAAIVRKMKLDNKNDERFQQIATASSEISYRFLGILVTSLAVILIILSIYDVTFKLDYVAPLLLLISAFAEVMRLVFIKILETKR